MATPFAAATSARAPVWTLACPDWEERLRTGQSLIPDLAFDHAAAARAVAIFNRLRLPDVPGKPLLAEAAGEWFRDIVRALFGSVDPETRARYIREIFALVPKKNSKTTYAAALMVTALLANDRPRAEFLFVGPTQAVSELAFNQAVGMILADEELKKRVHIQEHKLRITVRRPGTGARLQIKTFDTKVLTGIKPVGVLIDELHEIASDAKASRVIGQIRGGLLPNPEAFLIFITTQSDRPPAGVFRSELMKARAIRDGRATGTMLPVLYEFPERLVKSGAWEQPDLWPMVLPNLGRSISIDRLQQDFADARLAGEEEIRRWASQHLNIEIGLALHSDRWAGADFWEGAAEEGLTLEQLIERSEVVLVGIDGGGLDDLLGLAVLGRVAGSRDWLLWNRAWAHPLVLDRRKEEAPRLLDFERAGDMRIVEQIGDDLAEVADIVEQCEASGKLPEKIAIAVDSAGIGGIVVELASRGIATDRIVAVQQGWKLSGAIKTTERKLAEGTLLHAGQRLMDWCVGNAKVEPRGNAILITKQAAGAAKIDPLVATFNAVALMSTNPQAATDINAAILAGGGFL